MAGRSHNVPGQVTTLGKRFATVSDELLLGHARLTELIARYPLRGISGPMGTGQDMFDLLDGDEAKLAELQRRVADHLGVQTVLDSTGQVYPRSLDFDALSALAQVVAAPSNLAVLNKAIIKFSQVWLPCRLSREFRASSPHSHSKRPVRDDRVCILDARQRMNFLIDEVANILTILQIELHQKIPIPRC